MGKPVPVLDELPEIPSPLNDYYLGWHDLNAGRQLGQHSEQPIPFLEVERYADRMGFEVDFKFFYRIVKALDSVLLKHRSEERKREEEIAKRKAGNKRAPSRMPKKRR